MRYYTPEHEWVEVEGTTATVGITHYAQHALGDVVFVELPKIGAVVKAKQGAAVVESVKAASEVYSPVSGTVMEVNNLIANDPAQVNMDAEGRGWFFRLTLSNTNELTALMDRAAYDHQVKG